MNTPGSPPSVLNAIAATNHSKVPITDANEDWILEGVAPFGSDESLLAGLEEYVELRRELDG